MCNLYTQTRSVDQIASLFRDLELPLTFPEGIPNLPPGEITITDHGPIVQASREREGAYDLVVRRWSWPGPGGKPVYNFRSEGRTFPSGRCLILADGFYEFTAPSDPKQRRKDRWMFTSAADPVLGIAGLVRNVPNLGEAFTMLTTEPGPDVAAFHNREIAVLPPAAWRIWLDQSVPEAEVLKPLPAGSLEVRKSMA